MIKLKAIAECSVQLDKGRLDGSSGLMFGLIAHFIAERGRPVSRSTLAEYFWWNRDKREASHCLRQSIYKLRRLGAPIETSGEHYILGERAAVADFDCADERTLALSPLPPEEAVAVFPGFAPNASPTFLTWLERTREKAGRSIRGVLVRALGDARRRNSWEEAAKLARQCLVLDPLNEEATLTLAEYTALQGDKREALRMIDGYIEEIGGTYADLRLPASLLRNRISERVAYPAASAAAKVPLIGREESLQVLANVAEQVNSGAGHTCVLHGPPGIGKTRLLTEFANISAMRGARIIRVECHADAIERPLAVFMELAPKLLRMPGALGCSPEALKLVKRLGSFDPNERLDPDEYGGAAFLHAAVRSSLRDLVDAIASERPLYLLVEDVHWIDRVSLEVLKELIGSNRERQLLVVMTTRTLGDGTLLAGVDRRQLVVQAVPRLAPDKSRALATSVCGALGISDEGGLVDWCSERSDGNPLFVTELLSQWRETRDRSRIPLSLEALIDERVSSLDKAALHAMQAVALMEGEATCSALEAILGMQRWQVIGCVEQLEKAGLVALTTQKIAARHSLLGDAAISRIRESGASMLHRAIASHLTSDSTRGSTDAHLAWRAASHWVAAGATETALELVTAVARHMASVGAVYEAAALLDRSLSLCDSLSERLRILEERRRYLEAGGMSNELSDNCRLAMGIEQQLAGGSERIHSSNEIGYLAGGVYTRPSQELIAHALSCLECATAALDHRLAAASIAMIAAYGDSDADAGRRVAAAIATLTPRTVEERLHALRTQLIYEFEFGETSRAIDLADEYLSLYRTSSLGRLSQAVRISAYPHRIAGNFEIADQRMTEALSLARREGSPIDEAAALQWLAMSATDRADYKAAAHGVDLMTSHLARYPAAADLSIRQSIAVIALMVGNDSVAKTQLALMVGKPLPLHGRCAVLTAQIFAAMMAGEVCNDEALAQLTQMNDRLDGPLAKKALR
ncbi:MAG: AAA family ATPase [Gemmatimonadaceae bacterium]